MGRRLVKDGVDSIAFGRKPKVEAVPTFGALADSYVEAHKPRWRNAKHKVLFCSQDADGAALAISKYLDSIKRLGGNLLILGLAARRNGAHAVLPDGGERHRSPGRRARMRALRSALARCRWRPGAWNGEAKADMGPNEYSS